MIPSPSVVSPSSGPIVGQSSSFMEALRRRSLFKVDPEDAFRVRRFLESKQIKHAVYFEVFAEEGKVAFNLNMDRCTSFCDRCGLRPVAIVAPDPFVDEVYPEDGPYEDARWCAVCFEERKDEV